MPEKDILKSISDYLTLKGYLCFRNNTGAFRTNRNGKTGFYRFGMVGSGDLIGLTKNGTFFSIEVKMPGKVPSAQQFEFIEKVIKNKGIAFIAYDLNDVILRGF